ncbi:MAG TPA: hypothetical protein VI455_18465 [Terriglobia bacterium]
MVVEITTMERPVQDSLERFWRWAKKHPFAVTTAAFVLVAALALPLTHHSTIPPSDAGPDETPLFI